MRTAAACAVQALTNRYLRTALAACQRENNLLLIAVSNSNEQLDRLHVMVVALISTVLGLSWLITRTVETLLMNQQSLLVAMLLFVWLSDLHDP